MNFWNSSAQDFSKISSGDEDKKMIEENKSPVFLDNQKDETLMIENKQAQNALDFRIDLSKTISFEQKEKNNEVFKEETQISSNNNQSYGGNPFSNNNHPEAKTDQFIEESSAFQKEENRLTDLNENKEIEEVQSQEEKYEAVGMANEVLLEKPVEINEEKKNETFLQSVEDHDRIFQIEINKIVPNPYQPRRDFDDSAIQELAGSIREYGILEPLIVKRMEKEQQNGLNVEYQLIAGERRLRASKVVGLKTVPVLIRSFDNKCLELEVALVENVQREDLSPIMKARAYAQLVNEFGYTQEMVGRRIGKGRQSIANMLRLLQLPFEAQRALDENKISESHARALLLLPNMEKQRALLGEILSKQLSSREAEIIARQFLDKQGIKTTPTGRKRKGDSFDPKDLELREKLEDIFGSKVTIKRKGDMGEISIYFYSDDELDSLLEKMTNNSEKMINKTVDKLNNF